MFKTKEERYAFAVERNLENAFLVYTKKYAGLNREQAKHKLGIRKDDTRFDDRVDNLVKLANKERKNDKASGEKSRE